MVGKCTCAYDLNWISFIHTFVCIQEYMCMGKERRGLRGCELEVWVEVGVITLSSC